MLRNLLLIALGAAVGANLRYLLGGWLTRALGPGFPYGTFAVNLLGCLAIGWLLGWAAARGGLSEPLRLLLITGLLGGFTTFSSFGYEAYGLLLGGRWLAAGLYAFGSLGLGLAAVALGVALGRSLG